MGGRSREVPRSDGMRRPLSPLGAARENLTTFLVFWYPPWIEQVFSDSQNYWLSVQQTLAAGYLDQCYSSRFDLFDPCKFSLGSLRERLPLHFHSGQNWRQLAPRQWTLSCIWSLVAYHLQLRKASDLHLLSSSNDSFEPRAFCFICDQKAPGRCQVRTGTKSRRTSWSGSWCGDTESRIFGSFFGIRHSVCPMRHAEPHFCFISVAF